MIWNSIPLMTAIDLLIIAVTVYAIWRCRLVGPSKRPSAPQTGLRLIVLGLVGICLFYFVDLLSMYVSPAVMSRQAAMAFMDTLHQNVSWFTVLFAMVAISSGFIELRRTQIELAEKNELLASMKASGDGAQCVTGGNTSGTLFTIAEARYSRCTTALRGRNTP